MANPLDMVTQDQSGDDDVNPLERAITIRPLTDEVHALPPSSNPLVQQVAPEAPTELEQGLAALRDYLINGQFSPGTKVGNRLFGTGGEERYQTWPERMVRSGVSAAGDALSGELGYTPGLRREDVTDRPRPGGLMVSAEPGDPIIERALDMAGLAGGSALAERPGAATLGSGPVRPGGNMPSLIPAIKYKGNIIKGDPGDAHLSLIPKAAYDYVDKHHSGDLGYLDQVPGLQSGFIDDKGRFLNHDRAGQYAADYGLVAPEHQNLVRRGGLTSELLLSDTSKPGAAVAAAASSGPAPVFYSALEHAATSAAQDVMSPQQWLGYLKNQPGVKNEELQWTGLGDWLGQQKGKVSKKDVQSYLDENKVEIKDVTKKGVEIDEDAAHDQAYGEIVDKHPDMDPFSDGFQEMVFERAQQIGGGVAGGTKYSSYQLPGGDNYREHLLTLPEQAMSRVRLTDRGWEAFDKQGKSLGKFGSQDAALQRAKDAPGAMVDDASKTYRSSHWDEPNVLAHVRTNDRIIGDGPHMDTSKFTAVPEPNADIQTNLKNRGYVKEGEQVWLVTDKNGKEIAGPVAKTAEEALAKVAKANAGRKSLHIEEIQSDWHQQGRKQGYKQETQFDPDDYSVKKFPAGYTIVGKDGQQASLGHMWGDPKMAERYMKTDEFKQAQTETTGVPDAPFKTTWPELALKRMIRHAAENGYDRISWTPGEAQAARYDLSKQIDELHVIKDGDKFMVTAKPKGSRQMVDVGPRSKDSMTAGELADYVGKDMADKIAKQQEDTKSYEGVDLKVGGEGMREFYDRMLPRLAEKIGKAHEVKVKKTKIEGEDDHLVDTKANNQRVPTFDYIFDKVKERVGEKFDRKSWDKLSQAERDDYLEKAGLTPGGQVEAHYFDLPQSLKDHAMHKGFPLFMSGVPFPLTPVDHNPFGEKKLAKSDKKAVIQEIDPGDRWGHDRNRLEPIDVQRSRTVDRPFRQEEQ